MEWSKQKFVPWSYAPSKHAKHIVTSRKYCYSNIVIRADVRIVERHPVSAVPFGAGLLQDAALI